MKNLPIQVKIFLGLVIIALFYSITVKLYDIATLFYNSVTKYNLEYTELRQNQITTFDNNYLIFRDKSEIANINKETFIIVTEIIMYNRRDGQNLAWKWCQENQQIDYSEFTKFYVDLSNFTQERYKENNQIERRKQQLVKEYNLAISTFPGIIWNYFFKFKPLEYKEGFITKETATLFKNNQ